MVSSRRNAAQASSLACRSMGIRREIIQTAPRIGPPITTVNNNRRLSRSGNAPTSVCRIATTRSRVAITMTRTAPTRIRASTRRSTFGVPDCLGTPATNGNSLEEASKTSRMNQPIAAKVIARIGAVMVMTLHARSSLTDVLLLACIATLLPREHKCGQHQADLGATPRMKTDKAGQTHSCRARCHFQELSQIYTACGLSIFHPRR